MEAIAVALSADIAELRADDGLPDHIPTCITVLPQQRLLQIRVKGLPVETDPDRTTSHEVMNTLFELASDHNIITLDTASPPLFTQRIVLVDLTGSPSPQRSARVWANPNHSRRDRGSEGAKPKECAPAETSPGDSPIWVIFSACYWLVVGVKTRRRQPVLLWIIAA
ncbi:MAG TPA: hypothetical protein VNO31_46280 [Umezawaea sp.]|nr:hypothetical protein [Umezawaea sp.]